MEKPLISLCMIVKDEEQYLPRCLASVKEVVDEIIVVDTGSKDQTKAIAQSFGAKVYDFEWCDDFAAARNHSLEKATGKWILVLDADEELERDSGVRLKKLAQKDEADAYWVIQRNFYKNRLQHTLDVPVLRFFRNHPAYRYRKRYHEENATSILENQGRIGKVPEGLLIFHDGYLRSSAQGRPRLERSIRIMEAALKEEPRNAWLMAKLGIDLYSIGRVDEAYRYLYKFATSESGELDYQLVNLLDTHEALAYLADLAVQRGEFTLARHCGLASRQLTEVFELRMYSEFAVIAGTLGETANFLNHLLRSGVSLHPNDLTPQTVVLSKQKLTELTELEKDILALMEGFSTLLKPEQRNLLKGWLANCREYIQAIQRWTNVPVR